MGLCAAGRTSVGFLYLMELVPAKARAMVALLLGTMDSMTMIYATIYFRYFTHDSVYWELFSAFQNIIVLILVFFYLPESPKWLFEKGYLREAKETLIQIANSNGLNGEALRDINLASLSINDGVNDG